MAPMDSRAEIPAIRRFLDTKKGELTFLTEELSKEQSRLDILVQDAKDYEEARALIQDAAILTQSNLSFYIDSLVTSALQAVFGEKYSFVCKFEPRRGQTECDLFFQDKDGNLTSPMDDEAGGVVDIASFALRTVFWSLERTRPVLVLDEPMKWVSRSGGLIPLAAEMLRALSQKLGLQLIVITHIPEFIDVADRVFTVEQVDGISTVVEELQGG
jgi:DNA repair exonuclease SbcCD ATPase subunit